MNGKSITNMYIFKFKKILFSYLEWILQKTAIEDLVSIYSDTWNYSVNIASATFYCSFGHLALTTVRRSLEIFFYMMKIRFGFLIFHRKDT